jgi:ribosome-binding factor A
VLGHEVRLKFLPELEFEEDDAGPRAERVDELLRRIQKEEPDGDG